MNFVTNYILVGILVMLVFLVVAILAYPGPKTSSKSHR